MDYRTNPYEKKIKNKRDFQKYVLEHNWLISWEQIEKAFLEYAKTCEQGTIFSSFVDAHIFIGILQSSITNTLPKSKKGVLKFLCEKGILVRCFQDGTPYISGEEQPNCVKFSEKYQPKTFYVDPHFEATNLLENLIGNGKRGREETEKDLSILEINMSFTEQKSSKRLRIEELESEIEKLKEEKKFLQESIEKILKKRIFKKNK